MCLGGLDVFFGTARSSIQAALQVNFSVDDLSGRWQLASLRLRKKPSLSEAKECRKALPSFEGVWSGLLWRPGTSSV